MQVMLTPWPSSIEYIRAGSWRPLAVTTATRSESAATSQCRRLVPGYEASAGTASGAATRPRRHRREAQPGGQCRPAEPRLKARLATWAAFCSRALAADFGGSSADETAKWAKVVKFSGAKPD